MFDPIRSKKIPARGSAACKKALLVTLQNCRVLDPVGERLPSQRREASASVGDDPAAARERVEIFDDHAAVVHRPAVFEN
jgi:hypothetical protein